MMSGDNSETLFSLELLVDHIRLEKDCKVPDRIALGVRLLDFPTLLIYQHRSKSVGSNQPDRQREFAFNRGKSCFFKMNLDSLHVHLSATPLYAMVLDVSEESSPRLVGSSLISLAEAMDKIKLSSPSAHTGKGVVAVCNLSGEKIGALSLSYKLVCLGASLLPHITEGRGYKHTNTPGGQDQEHSKENMKSGSMCSPTGNKSEFSIHSCDAGESRIQLDEHEEDDCAGGQTNNTSEEDSAAFCPPHLYYSNITQGKSGNTEQDYRLLNLDTEAFTCEDSICEDEEDKQKVGSVSKVVLQKMTHATKTSRRQETSEAATNILREALQQLPLLNALVAELSQLTIHPSPALITRPAMDYHGNSPRAQSLYNTTHLPDTHLNLPPPRSCSTPMVNHLKVKDNQKGTLNSRKSQRKKLTYGTTKTFNLRLKQISPLKVNNRECIELMKSGTQSRTAKEKEKSNPKTVKSKKRGFLLDQSSNLDENIETVMQSFTLDSALRETVSLKPKTQQGARDSRAQGVSEDFHPLKELKCIPSPIPSVHSDSAPLSKDKYKHHNELDQSHSHFDRDKFGVSVPDLTEKQSSRCNSPESLFSECSITENDANYADDFDSLESSKASSDRSPEPSRAKTPKSPVSPDSYISNSRSKGFQKRPDHHPVPVKALNSPRRVLMGTHIIQPRTHSSALSFSSDADSYDMDKPSSSQTVCSRNQANASDKMEQSSSAESVLSSRSEKKNSSGNRNHVRGFSAQSTSSFEAQEVEEVEDELGSLDFRKEYQHISELVASKLPGYTM